MPTASTAQSKCVAGLLAALALVAGAGCSVSDLNTRDRMSRGLVIVLPGIEGRSAYNVNIARGLDDGGVGSAIDIYDWNVPIPGGALLNLTAYERNLEQARKLARRIMDYQKDFPGRSVHLIGHSGGAGITVLTLEQLPANRRISSALLLAGAVSQDYNLAPALRRTQFGIFNYYSPADVGFLRLGTSIFGNIDRGHGSAAGAVGFARPAGLTEPERQEYRKLHQIRWSKQMSRYGNSGGHTGWANRRFVRRYLAPLILEQQRTALGDAP